MCHITNETMALLQEPFDENVIPRNYSARFCILTRATSSCGVVYSRRSTVTIQELLRI